MIFFSPLIKRIVLTFIVSVVYIYLTLQLWGGCVTKGKFVNGLEEGNWIQSSFYSRVKKPSLS